MKRELLECMAEMCVRVCMREREKKRDGRTIFRIKTERRKKYEEGK